MLAHSAFARLSSARKLAADGGRTAAGRRPDGGPCGPKNRPGDSKLGFQITEQELDLPLRIVERVVDFFDACHDRGDLRLQNL